MVDELEPPLLADLNAISASLRVLFRKLGYFDEGSWTVSLGSPPNGWRVPAGQN